MAVVVVTDGEQRSALAAVRSLGAAGHQVVVCASNMPCLASASRHAWRARRTPDPLIDPQAFVRELLALASEYSAAIVMPVADASHLAIAELWPDDADCRPAFAPASAFAQLCDKQAVYSAGVTLGIDVPRQVVLRSRRDVAAAVAGCAEGRLVAKPSRSVSGTPDRRLKQSVTMLAGSDELAPFVAGLPDEAFPLLVQEYIEGYGAGVFLLRWGGVTLASFAHERIREKPPTGGVCVTGRSSPVDPGLREASIQLLDAFDWSGVAMVEYRVRHSDGRAFLMEVNPRLWGSLQLAVDAGIDFPKMLVHAALGDSPSPTVSEARAVEFHWLWGEVDYLLYRARRRVRRSELAGVRDSIPVALGRIAAAHLRGMPDCVLRLSDPAPFALETRRWFVSLLGADSDLFGG